MGHWWRLPRWVQGALGAYLPPRPSQRCFYLTFDDGPLSTTSPFLLELLPQWGHRATFFWLWSQYRQKEAPLLLSSIREGGHSVALHGWQHLSNWRKKRRERVREVRWAWECWKRAGAPIVPYYRPPYGHIHRGLPSPLQLVLWDLMPPDYLWSKGWIETLVRKLRLGDIVVLHERAWNRKAWQVLFSVLASEGWKAVALPPAQEELPQVEIVQVKESVLLAE